MLKMKLQQNDLVVEVELSGPYDKHLREVVTGDVVLKHGQDAIFGTGMSYRQAIESALKNTRGTPHADAKVLYSQLLMPWIDARPDADMVQGDTLCRVLCVLKVPHRAT